MKKLLLPLFFLTLLSTSNAQNWRPFNPNDNMTQFVADSSLSPFPVHQPPFKPINSMVVDTSYQQNGITVQVFKKGYSYRESDLNQYRLGYTVLARILGDTIFYHLDSTVIRSKFDFTFDLNFPKTIPSNKFLLGKSDSTILYAELISSYTDTIFNSNVDSLKELLITAQPIYSTSHTASVFDSCRLVLSKNHGLIKTPDFSSLTGKLVLNRFNFPDTSKYFTGFDHYQFNVGDEVHLRRNYRLYGPNNYNGYENIKIKIISKSRSGDSLFGTYRFINEPHSVSTSYIDAVYNYSLSLNDTITKKLSQTLDSSSIFSWCHINSFKNSYLAYRKTENSDFPYVFRDHSNLQYFSPSCDSIWIVNGGLFGTNKTTIIGTGFPRFKNESFSWGFGGVGASSIEISLAFAAINGDTLGTPQNFSTSLFSAPIENKAISIYPNPTSNRLFLSTSKEFAFCKIYDQNGRLVKHWNSPKNELNVSELPNGLYFINLQTQSGELINQKFVKQ